MRSIEKILLAGILVLVLAVAVWFGIYQNSYQNKQDTYRNQALAYLQQGEYEKAKSFLWQEANKQNPDALTLCMYCIATAGYELNHAHSDIETCTMLGEGIEQLDSIADDETRAILEQTIDQILEPYMQNGYDLIRKGQYSEAGSAVMGIEYIPENYHHLYDVYLFCDVVKKLSDTIYSEEDKIKAYAYRWEQAQTIDTDNPWIPEDVRDIMKAEIVRLGETNDYYIAHADEIHAKAEIERQKQDAERKRQLEEDRRREEQKKIEEEKRKRTGSSAGNSGERAHGFYGSTDEYEDYDDYMDAYSEWEYRDYDDMDDWEDDWDEDE